MQFCVSLDIWSCLIFSLHIILPFLTPSSHCALHVIRIPQNMYFYPSTISTTTKTYPTSTTQCKGEQNCSCWETNVTTQNDWVESPAAPLGKKLQLKWVKFNGLVFLVHAQTRTHTKKCFKCVTISRDSEIIQKEEPNHKPRAILENDWKLHLFLNQK